MAKRIPREIIEKFDKEVLKNIQHKVMGSYIRGKADCKDLDILVEEKYVDFWKNLDNIKEVKIAGNKHANIIVEFEGHDIPIDIFYYEPKDLGTYKAYLAGNKIFNVVLRSYTKKHNLKLNQKYLEDVDSGEIEQFADEKILFHHLGLEFIPYEEREIKSYQEGWKLIKKYKFGEPIKLCNFKIKKEN